MLDPLFCDNHLLVAIKKEGMSTQPHGKHQENLTDLMKEYVGKKFNKPGLVFLEPIHRLDQAASGIVLFARTSKALSRLQQQMREKKIQKFYLALVTGEVQEGKSTLVHFLVHDEYKARVVSSSHPDAKKAELIYEFVGKEKRGTLLCVELITGRYHQIRVQLSQSGLPIVGDQKYGSTAPWKGEGIALHHGRLVLEHPVTKERLEFSSIPSWCTSSDSLEAFF